MSNQFLSMGQLRRTLPSMELSYNDVHRPAFDIKDVSSGYFLGISLGATKTRLAFGSDRLRPVSMVAGSLLFLPPGADMAETYHGGSSEYIALSFEPSQFEQDLSAVNGSLCRQDLSFPGVDASALALAREIRRHLLSGEAEGSLYLSELSRAVFRRCLVVYSTAGGDRPDLSAPDLARVLDYVEAHLDQPLSIDELADQTSVPASALSEAFRSKVQQTVAAYVLDRRVARAREMIRRSEEPLATVAHACGFSSQQHMTNTFSAKLGISPGRYRKLMNH